MELEAAYNILGVRPWASQPEVQTAHHVAVQSCEVQRRDPGPVNQALDAIRAAGFPPGPPGSPQGYPPPPQGYPPQQQGWQGQPPPPQQQGWQGQPAQQGWQGQPAPQQQQGWQGQPAPQQGWQGQPQQQGWQGQPPPPGWNPQQPWYPPGPPPHPPLGPKSRNAGAQIGIGLLLLIVGIAITAGTHDAAESAGGGTYIVAYGPIIFGVVTLFRGLIGLMQPSNPPRR